MIQLEILRRHNVTLILWPFDPKPNQFIFVPRCTNDKFGENPSIDTGYIAESKAAKA